MVCGLVCVAPVPVRLRGDILRVQNAIATAPGAQLQVRHRIVRLPADDEDETVRRVSTLGLLLFVCAFEFAQKFFNGA